MLQNRSSKLPPNFIIRGSVMQRFFGQVGMAVARETLH